MRSALKRLDWAIILLMDTPFVLWQARKYGVGWRAVLRFWWATSRAMWKYGE